MHKSPVPKVNSLAWDRGQSNLSGQDIPNAACRGAALLMTSRVWILGPGI